MKVTQFSRRQLLKRLSATAAAAGVALTSKWELNAQEKVARATRGMGTPKIKDIKAIGLQPIGRRLAIVKVTTDQDGLYGWGCASYTGRADLVCEAVERYLKPLMLGRTVDRIQEIWEVNKLSGYWRNGPIMNNAVSGIDGALWDIKGRMANMPVYDLWGGKVREAAASYIDVHGPDGKAVVESIRQYMAKGYKYVRIGPGAAEETAGGAAAAGGPGRGGANRNAMAAAGLHPGPVLERRESMRWLYNAFDQIRSDIGSESKIELMHDMHERYDPREAIQFLKDCEKFHLFFLEDPIAPENNDWFRQMRAATTTPIAMGELYNNPLEWNQVIMERLIDFIRCHVSQTGGPTEAKKIAALCEPLGIKTAWHGPKDVSPLGHTIHLHIDLTTMNFGIQEHGEMEPLEKEIFKGTAEVKDGYLWASNLPGWGIEVDEQLAMKYPIVPGGGQETRLVDGTVVKR